jgi:hypothetical protein
MNRFKLVAIVAFVAMAALITVTVNPAGSQSGDPTPEDRGLGDPGAPAESAGDVGDNDQDSPFDVEQDQVILDDLIVDGSICAGMDCVNGESFGFDTMRLKENNLRIKFDDTSNSASFPSNDWQITINDSSNGGQNKFSIDDISGARTPFTLEAAAPSHSLYVDNGGRLGLGTNNPVVEAHIVDGDTPTIRLEQDGSSGFGAQTWDVAANETNFFIRDASNGSTLPFRISPGSPSNLLTIGGTTCLSATAAMCILNNQRIGLGTGSPLAPFHLKTNSSGVGNAVFLLERSGGALALKMSDGDTNNSWLITMTNDGTKLKFTKNGAGGSALILEADGDIKVQGCINHNGGTIIGVCTP